MTHSRRSVLSAIGASLPLGLAAGPRASAQPIELTALRFLSFEESVRAAFGPNAPTGTLCRIEVGHSDLIRAGVQGCRNDGPFAGYPAGHLRIVRAGSGPGPVRHGVRLYLSTVDVVLTREPVQGRPLDFRMIPPAPTLG